MKLNKICIMLIVLIFIISFTNCIYASTNNTITEIGNDWIKLGERNDAVFNQNTSVEGFLEIAGLLKGIGIFVAVGVGIILGIKFMLSTAEGKAEIKKLLTPYIVGIIIVVGALLIWKIAIGILDI